VIAVRRERLELGRKVRPPSEETGHHATALAAALSDDELLAAIRSHWDAMGSGAHHWPDGSFGEDVIGVSRGEVQF